MKTFRQKLTEKLKEEGFSGHQIEGILIRWERDPVSKGVNLDDAMDDHEPNTLLLIWISLERFKQPVPDDTGYRNE